MPKVSVIMPVYNTELFVERAIVSLMEQTLNDLEFIIIDDGSKDDSLSIINQVIARYPARERQVILISRENRGVAATRAQGMELATGDYVIHLDSDDWAELDWVEALYNKAIEENADVVLCDYSLVFCDGNKRVNQRVFNSGFQCISSLIENGICNANWNKLIKLSLIKKNNISYENNIDMGEDFIFSLKTFFFAKKVSKVSSSLYYYNQLNENALTKDYTDKALSDVKKIVPLILQFFREKGVADVFFHKINYIKLNVKSVIIANANSFQDVECGIALYPETLKALFFSVRHWRLKIYTILFFLKFDFLLNFLYKNKFKS